jgi:argininosuccinate lyase
MTVTGRIDAAPSDVWNEEVLAPQFAYEAEHLLGHYVAIEKALLLEYRRMGLVGAAGAAALAGRLDTLSAEAVRADPEENMSDLSFAIERHVAAGPVAPFAAWHVDRSRNDLQTCAQLMSAREQAVAVADDLLAFGRSALRLAGRHTGIPMPGYTHAQAAQVVTPGFYFTALSAEVIAAVQRLAATYDQIDACPLGAGALAGQELAWDRGELAASLGFARPRHHALMAIASRGWALSLASDLSNFAVVLSRFATDLMTWGGSGHGFLELPDELCGISAAMPQKRNYPVLERIRGRCSHVVGAAQDLATGQRNTPYSNTVEVSKEAGARLRTLIDALRSTLRLSSAVVDNLGFDAQRMREICAAEYLGGFTLANKLTLEAGIPWRTSQIVAGRYVKAAVDRGLLPADADAALLESLAKEAGYPVPDPAAMLGASFGVEEGIRAKKSAGSTNPDAVRATAQAQEIELAELADLWRARRAAVADAAVRLERRLREPAAAEPA